MELRDYVRVLRKQWLIVLICALVTTAAAAAYTINSTRLYQSCTKLFVSTSDRGDVTALYQGSLLSQQRVKSYADLISGPQLASSIVDQVHPTGLTADQVQARLSASAIPDTVLLQVCATDPIPSRAQQIASAVGAIFPKQVQEIEAPAGGGLSPVKVSVVQKAELPASPVSPKPARNLALALVLGLLIGVGVALLRETLDTTVKNSEDAQKAVDGSILGVIGFDPDAGRSPLIVQTDPHSPRAEAFRQLRTNLQFVDIDHPVKSIVVTSSIPNEGKTTTTANLAITMAQAGLSVILIEGDLRRPKLMDYLGLEGAVGLTSVLIGRASLDDTLQRWGDGLLTVLPAGPSPPNPSELLGSQQMADLISELHGRADVVLIDAPPLLPVTDAAVLAKICDGALIVVRQGHTKRDQLQRAADNLRVVDAHVLGAVLNMTPAKGPDAYAYGYGYRYAPTQPATTLRARTGGDVVPDRGSRRRRATDRGLPARSYSGPERRAAATGDTAGLTPAKSASGVSPSPAPLAEGDLESFFTGGRGSSSDR